MLSTPAREALRTANSNLRLFFEPQAVPIGRALAVDAETGGDFSPFLVGLQQGVRRGFLAADACRHGRVQGGLNHHLPIVSPPLREPSGLPDTGKSCGRALTQGPETRDDTGQSESNRRNRKLPQETEAVGHGDILPEPAATANLKECRLVRLYLEVDRL